MRAQYQTACEVYSVGPGLQGIQVLQCYIVHFFRAEIGLLVVHSRRKSADEKCSVQLLSQLK